MILRVLRRTTFAHSKHKTQVVLLFSSGGQSCCHSTDWEGARWVPWPLRGVNLRIKGLFVSWRVCSTWRKSHTDNFIEWIHRLRSLHLMQNRQFSLLCTSQWYMPRASSESTAVFPNFQHRSFCRWTPTFLSDISLLTRSIQCNDSPTTLVTCYYFVPSSESISLIPWRVWSSMLQRPGHNCFFYCSLAHH